VRHLLTLADRTAAEILGLLGRARAVKAAASRYVRALYEKTLLMIFAAPSLRTRLSFETAMTQLHGHAINYYTVHSPWGVGKESIEDFARTVSRYCDAVAARVFSHDDLCRFAAAASVPVINAMTNGGHPCQVLGDLLTIGERLGRTSAFTLAYAGDACNNVTYSLMRASVKLGFDLRIACPDLAEYRPEPQVVAELAHIRESGGRVEVIDDVAAAVAGADVVYTDSWMSYRVPAEHAERRARELGPYQVTAAVLARAAPGALFMHCLPAQRGMEVTAEVIDGPQSIVFDQAENRLHVEKAILLELLGGTGADQR
jgi:ornithine carbamoyltransferase